MEFSSSIEKEGKVILQRYNRNPIWVHLIDADSKILNLALMQFATYHKARGDRVTMSKGDKLGFCNKAPDKIYISIVGLMHLKYKIKHDKHCDLNLHFKQLNVNAIDFLVQLCKSSE